MRTHRIHTAERLETGREVRLAGRSGQYLSRVLRVATGQRVVLFNGDGHDYIAEVERPGRKELILSIISRKTAATESGLNITVVQAISRGERMDQTLQKCTELGVTAFQPMFTERVEVRLRADRIAGRIEHWQAVVVSACEQSGRAVVPRVHRPVSLFDWMDQDDDKSRVALVPGAESRLASLELDHRRQLALAVGPEGGFSDAELGLMQARGILAAGLGPRILRTETAAPAAVAVLQARFGDLA